MNKDHGHIHALAILLQHTDVLCHAASPLGKQIDQITAGGKLPDSALPPLPSVLQTVANSSFQG